MRVASYPSIASLLSLSVGSLSFSTYRPVSPRGGGGSPSSPCTAAATARSPPEFSGVASHFLLLLLLPPSARALSVYTYIQYSVRVCCVPRGDRFWCAIQYVRSMRTRALWLTYRYCTREFRSLPFICIARLCIRALYAYRTLSRAFFFYAPRKIDCP